MAAQIVLVGSLLVIIAVLAAVIGAVDNRERYLFVLGIAAVIAVHALPGTPATAGALLALLGLAVAVAATVPLLRAAG